MWQDLPGEVLASCVLRHLDAVDIVYGVSATCRQWREATADSLLWRLLYERDFSLRDATNHSLSSCPAEMDWKQLYIHGHLIRRSSGSAVLVDSSNARLHHRPRAGHACVFIQGTAGSDSKAETGDNTSAPIDGRRPMIAAFGGYTTNYSPSYDIDLLPVHQAWDAGGNVADGGGSTDNGDVKVHHCSPAPTDQRVPPRHVLPGWLHTVVDVDGQLYLFGAEVLQSVVL